MLRVVLEGLKQPQVLAHVPPHSQVVHARVPQDLVVVDEEGPPQGNPGIVQDPVVRGNLLVNVRDEGDVDGAESSHVFGLEGPPPVDEVGVDGAADDLAAVFPEGLGVVAEIDDFGGADEGEVEGVEEEEQPLALVVGEGELLELVGGADPGVGLEEGSCFPDDCFRCLACHKIYLYQISEVSQYFLINLRLRKEVVWVISKAITNYKMDKFTDSTLGEVVSPGLYSQSDILNIEMMEKVKHSVDLTLLCNRVCFRGYRKEMSPAEEECH